MPASPAATEAQDTRRIEKVLVRARVTASYQPWQELAFLKNHFVKAMPKNRHIPHVIKALPVHEELASKTVLYPFMKELGIFVPNQVILEASKVLSFP